MSDELEHPPIAGESGWPKSEDCTDGRHEQCDRSYCKCLCHDAPIAGESDPEYSSRIDAQRVTAEWRTKSSRKVDSGKCPITESPLFGGDAQADLF